MKSFLIRYERYILISVFLILYLILAYKLNIWVDECFSLNTSQKPSIKQILDTSVVFEAQPPFYFFLLSLWLKINNSIFFARALSSIFIVLSVLVIRKILLVTNNMSSTWFLLIFLLNPFFFWAATESRCYALVILFCAILTYFYFLAYIENKSSYRLIYIVISTVAINTQYFIGIFLVANAVHLFIYRDWKSFWRYILDMSFVVLSLAWTVPFMYSEVSSHVGAFNSKESLLEILKFLPSRIDNYIFAGYLFPIKIIRYLLFAFILIYTFTGIKQLSKFQFFSKNNIFFTQAIISALSFLVLYPILGDDFVTRRHTSIMFIPCLVCLLLILQNISNKRKVIVLSVILASYAISNINTYIHPVKDFDIKGATKYVQDHESANEPVLIFNNQIGMPIRKYYNGPNQLIVFPDTIKDTEPFDYTFLNRDITSEDFGKIISKYNEHHKIFWMIYPDVAANNDNLDRLIILLDNNYKTLMSFEIKDNKHLKTYDAITVRKLEQK
jgi:hypothetical protein